METLTERFLRYVKINTQSSYDSGKHPSTQSQMGLARILAAELEEIGLKEIKLTENCFLTATLPSNTDIATPVIGFIAHLDTSPDMSGENVNPQVIKNYNGGDIVLNSEKNIVLSQTEFPSLLNRIGEDLIVTDGTTLLGADDKAGIAEIVTAMDHLIRHPEIKHGKIRICFSPDEEIGEGADYFDVPGFGADFAYTMDGDELGSLEYENFNAASARVEIKGRNIHPGTAKNKMINSILIGMELNSMLPAVEVPSRTEGYEGFYHLNDLSGNVEETTMKYLIRDHDHDKFEAKKAALSAIANKLDEKYGAGTVKLILKDQYYNMKEKILPVFQIVETARKAMELNGIKPVVKPIRGGTDGSRLTFMGLPTPNIFTGGTNFHGKYEYVSINTMQKAVDVIVKIAELAAEEPESVNSAR